MSHNTISTQGFILQESPKILCVTLPGSWLLDHTTPSWRIVDPIVGFQRMVTESRAKQIAVAVLDQRHTFPNAIVLATDIDTIEVKNERINIPNDARFLVVDGQHRLWAQQFSGFSAQYGCFIHAGLSQEEMAKLFLEINENQKRVPASLRWDLTRLIQPADDPERLAAAEIVYLLATERESPFFQRIDLTGEQSEIQIKQATLAPEFQRLLRPRGLLRGYSFLEQHSIILEYSIAIQQVDFDRWGTRESPFFSARVLRPLFRLMADLLAEIGTASAADVKALKFMKYLERIDEDNIRPEYIRSMQGSAGMAAIYRQIKKEVLEI